MKKLVGGAYLHYFLRFDSGDQREPGWWIQQLIKIGAATQIPNISSAYVVWDGESSFFSEATLCLMELGEALNNHFLFSRKV